MQADRAHLSELRHSILPSHRQGRLDVIQNDFPCNSVQLSVASGRQLWKPSLELADHPLSGVTCQCSEPLIEAKLAMLVADEIEHRQH